MVGPTDWIPRYIKTYLYMFQTDRPQAMTPDLSKADSDAERLLRVS